MRSSTMKTTELRVCFFTRELGDFCSGFFYRQRTRTRARRRRRCVLHRRAGRPPPHIKHLRRGTMRLAALTTLLASTRAASSFTPSLASIVSGASVAFVPSSVAVHQGTSQLSTTRRSFRSSTSLKMSADQDKEALINCPTIPLRDGTKQ